MKNNRHLTKDETMIIVESFLNPDYDISDKKDKLTDMILNPDNRLMNDEFKAILFNNYWHKEDFEKYDSLSKEFGYELKENLTLIIRFHNLDNNMISKKCNYINQLDFIDDVIKNQLLEENKSYMMRTYFDIIEKLNKIDDIFTQDFNEKFIKKINEFSAYDFKEISSKINRNRIFLKLTSNESFREKYFDSMQLNEVHRNNKIKP